MSKKCFDDFGKLVGRIVEADEKETLLQKVRSTKEQLRINRQCRLIINGNVLPRFNFLTHW